MNNYWIIAGFYLQIAVAGGSVSPARLETVQARAETTRAKLESGDAQQLASLTREDLLGDLFHAGTLAYFGQLDGLATLQARQQGLQTNLAPSAGTYGYTPKVTYLFGLPQAIEPGGVTMDLDRIARTNGGLVSTDERVRFNTQIGALSSALEHGVPEQMFSTDDHQAEGISAVKALAIANQEGQRIYRITPANQSAVMPQINLSSEVKDEIRAAVAAGNEVTTHTDPVAVPGYQGAGYVILDPDTGAGAWKIGGGANGGFLDNYPSGLVAGLLFLATLMAGLGPIAFVLVALLAVLAVFNTAMILMQGDMELKESGCSQGLSALFVGTVLAFAIGLYFIPFAAVLLALNLAAFVAINAPLAVSSACKNLRN